MTIYTEKCSPSITGHTAGVREILGQAFSRWMRTQRLRKRLAEERRQLLEMPDYLLDDMGLSRQDAIEESLREDIPLARLK